MLQFGTASIDSVTLRVGTSCRLYEFLVQYSVRPLLCALDVSKEHSEDIGLQRELFGRLRIQVRSVEDGESSEDALGPPPNRTL